MRPNNIELIKQNINIVDAATLCNIKINSNGFCLCPNHEEKTPSCKINTTTGFFYCFGCGASGDLLELVRMSRKISLTETIQLLLESFGLESAKATSQTITETKILQQVFNHARIWFYKNMTDQARNTLYNRGITQASIERFSIGWAPSNLECRELLQELSANFPKHIIDMSSLFFSQNQTQICCFYNRIIFPIINAKGQCVGFGGRAIHDSAKAKYINSTENIVFTKHKLLYNYYHAYQIKSDTVDNIYVVEGYIDAIMMSQHGFPKTVAILGTTLSEDHLQSCWKTAKNIVLLFDGDRAGMVAIERSIKKALSIINAEQMVKIALLPPSYDPDTFLRSHTVDALQSIISQALPIHDFLWNKCSKIDINQPQELAKFFGYIKRALLVIKDTDVKRAYSLFFNQQYKQLMQQNTFVVEPKHNTSNEMIHQSPPRPPSSIYKQQNKQQTRGQTESQTKPYNILNVSLDNSSQNMIDLHIKLLVIALIKYEWLTTINNVITIIPYLSFDKNQIIAEYLTLYAQNQMTCVDRFGAVMTWEYLQHPVDSIKFNLKFAQLYDILSGIFNNNFISMHGLINGRVPVNEIEEAWQKILVSIK